MAEVKTETHPTLLQHAVKFLGWQGGTIHQVIEEFKKYPEKEKDFNLFIMKALEEENKAQYEETLRLAAKGAIVKALHEPEFLTALQKHINSFCKDWKVENPKAKRQVINKVDYLIKYFIAEILPSLRT